MSLVVQKFGGSSVANAERVFNVARIITDKYKEGNQVVVVVSAQGDTTDDLIEKAKEISERPSKREMDMLLATGEQISISLLAMAIEKLGCPAISLTGWQAGFNTSSQYGMARIHKINTERLKVELDKNKIVVVAGFQGINKYDDITTLGRGGSDTSAVALAAALSADVCEIYTDVDGVYTTDPRICPNAVKLNDISYDEMLELASLGANVLNNRSVEMAKKYNVKLKVLSSLRRVEGTTVKEVKDVEKMMVRGVARDNNTASIAVMEVDDQPGKVYTIFSKLAAKEINVDLIIQSEGRGGTRDISFTVASDRLQEALDVLNAANDVIGAKKIVYDDTVSKVSIVGAGMVSNAGVASKMFEALFQNNINVRMIATSEIKVSVLIDRADAERAVVAIHDKFDLGRV